MTTAKRHNSRGMTGHHRPGRGASDEWLTPPDILRALGPFSLDPCCPPNMPWRTAHFMHSPGPAWNGLTGPWFGRVWLNPPYGAAALGPWLKRLADHGDGVALVFARTETAAFFEQGWRRPDAMLFLRGRLHFHRIDGTRAAANAGAPSVLIAYGADNGACLRACGLVGQYVPLTPEARR